MVTERRRVWNENRMIKYQVTRRRTKVLLVEVSSDLQGRLMISGIDGMFRHRQIHYVFTAATYPLRIPVSVSTTPVDGVSSYAE
jgi:hypothetical protein